MRESPHQQPKALSSKRSRTAEEISQLALVLGADWRPADRLQTWLKRHEGRALELSALVHDGWSWADIGLAMHEAGISYSTGRAIAADILRFKAYVARKSERDRAARLLQGPQALAAISVQQTNVSFEPSPVVAARGSIPVQSGGSGVVNPQPLQPSLRPPSPLDGASDGYENDPEKLQPARLARSKGVLPPVLVPTVPPLSPPAQISPEEGERRIAAWTGKATKS